MNIDKDTYQTYLNSISTQIINETNMRYMLPDKYKFEKGSKTKYLLNYNLLGIAIKKVYDIIYFKN